ncbi:MAG: hypothetical protein ACYCYP_03305 [Leptospirales bacterium]
MTRELIRRSCGHLEAVYAVGSGVSRIREKEMEFCGVCRERRRFSGHSDQDEGEDDRKASEERDLRGEARST